MTRDFVAQRQIFDSYLDKAAAKEDFQELAREKKRVRFEPADSEEEPIDRAKKVETAENPLYGFVFRRACRLRPG